ncbi:hypothetical protein BC343_08915 [Mucilaginibacter pedocola]|uniref:Uncharacterized protein n=1 Tax=Mucilaginibacter pedocola TaxID=1792845 RepID=A0A1S9PCS6_9SPHI|nr:hypothetical protein BC343_08915 [Mucilaginibacter pedocola]
MFLFGSNFTGAHAFSKAHLAIRGLFTEHVKPEYTGLNTSSKFTHIPSKNRLSKLSAAEFEDENVRSGGSKKQIAKTNPADVFLNAWSFANLSNIVNHNLLPRKLTAVAAVSKIYLAIRVFRL